MKLALLACVVVIIGGVGYYFRLHTKLRHLLPTAPTLSATLPVPASPKEEQPATSAGKVAGVSTDKLQALRQSLLQTGAVLGKSVSTVLLEPSAQTVQNQIHVDKLVSQIGKQFENVPAALLQQAKVAYCQQVLIEATKSANSQ